MATYERSDKQTDKFELIVKEATHECFDRQPGKFMLILKVANLTNRQTG